MLAICYIGTSDYILLDVGVVLAASLSVLLFQISLLAFTPGPIAFVARAAAAAHAAAVRMGLPSI